MMECMQPFERSVGESSSYAVDQCDESKIMIRMDWPVFITAHLGQHLLGEIL
jgi:hypothetical protein